MKKFISFVVLTLIMAFTTQFNASAKVNPERLIGTWEDVYITPDGQVGMKTALQLTAYGAYTWAFYMAPVNKTVVETGSWHLKGNDLILTNKKGDETIYKVISVDHNNLRVIDDGDEDVTFRLVNNDIISAYPNQEAK